MDDPIECQLERVNGQIEISKLYAQLWMISAQTGAAKNKIILRGSKLMTDEEKIQDALDTAKKHIRKIDELTETKINLMKMQSAQHSRHKLSDSNSL